MVIRRFLWENISWTRKVSGNRWVHCRGTQLRVIAVSDPQSQSWCTAPGVEHCLFDEGGHLEAAGAPVPDWGRINSTAVATGEPQTWVWDGRVMPNATAFNEEEERRQYEAADNTDQNCPPGR